MNGGRPARPLDPDAVKAANETVWKEFGLPPGTQLTLGAKDYPARKRWMQAYNDALKKKSAPAPPPAPQPPSKPVEQCDENSQKTCADLWKDIDSETDKIANISDPEERNRKISAAYANLQLQNPKLKWIGLAAIVSRQAGCAMKYADQAIKDAGDRVKVDEEMLSSPWTGDAAGGIGIDLAIAATQRDAATTAKEALGVANKAIFKTIYPSIAFYQKYGLAKLKQCAYDADGRQRVPEKVQRALERLEGGRPEDERAAADLLADYEQRDIVDKEVYQVEKYKDVLKDNENWSSWKRLWIGRLFGAKPAQIPLSSTCNGKEVESKGSILNPDDRVQYYNALMDKYLSNGPAWQQQTLQDIVNQGQ